MGRIEELIGYGREHDCSDIHLTYGMEPVVRCGGKLVTLRGYGVMEDELLEEIRREILDGAHGADGLKNTGGTDWSEKGDVRALQDIDLCYETKDHTRNRINIYRQQQHTAVAIRLLNAHIPTLEELGMPPVLRELTGLRQGLVLVTGPTGSGKSTTLAACLDEINRTQHKHILTIEDPVEYRHTSQSCIVNQREVGVDTADFASALRSALREDPDIILVGEMRDPETISAAVTAAETGHLVFSTLHTVGAASTIDRIVDVFPPHQQHQIRTQLAMVLKAVISQQLVPKTDGSGRLAAQEILLVNDAAANMIREDKCHQIISLLQMNAGQGMQSMDAQLYALTQQKLIRPETAIEYGSDKAALRQRLSGQ